METKTHHFGTLPRTADSAQTNRVLRNTYALLGLSMVPTIIGAVIGVQFALPLFKALGPIGAFVLMLAVVFGLGYAIQANRNSSLGVGLLLLFTLFMGIMLGPLLSVALGLRNGAQLIAMAAGGTGIIFFTLAGIAATTKRDFTNMGKFLFVGLMVLILCVVANLFLQMPLFSLVISGFVILLFSGYILYDISTIVHGGETSYVSATLGVYISVFNIFTSLLHLLMAFFGERE